MTSLLTSPPLGGLHSLRRFSVDEYHLMIQAGVLDESDTVELLNGYVVLKMPRNPPHDGTIDLVREALNAVLPAGWVPRSQQAITLADSEPEPDFVLARGNKRTYLTRHPGPADVGLVIEVADSSLDRDRLEKGPIYAEASIPIYWIINLVANQLEVYTAPDASSPTPGYTQRQDLAPGASVALTLDGRAVATLAVADLLP